MLDRPTPTDRTLLSAEVLSIGSELTVGDTRDTNGGELALALTGLGVAVTRITALPDRLDVVTEAFRTALSRVDLVVSTGGLGPTPDDLTREAIAAACDEMPVVDPVLERWLRSLWARRGLAFPEANLKQAWVIPSAEPLSNPNGSAPGWLVSRPDGRAVVALPGPPREMRPMWENEALPRLRARAGGLGSDVVAHTYRLTGIGESLVAEILGDDLLRGSDPEVATYARVEAVDVRISAIGRSGRPASEVLATTAALVEERLGAYIWATGSTTWSGAIGSRLAARGWRLRLSEIATGGQVAALFGDVDWLDRADSTWSDDLGSEPGERDRALAEQAARIRAAESAVVGLAVVVRETDGDSDVAIAVDGPAGIRLEHRTAFLGGRTGRMRAAINAAAVLLSALDEDAAGTRSP